MPSSQQRKRLLLLQAWQRTGGSAMQVTGEESSRLEPGPQINGTWEAFK